MDTPDKLTTFRRFLRSTLNGLNYNTYFRLFRFNNLRRKAIFCSGVSIRLLNLTE
jgi:hypothetical protein